MGKTCRRVCLSVWTEAGKSPVSHGYGEEPCSCCLCSACFSLLALLQNQSLGRTAAGVALSSEDPRGKPSPWKEEPRERVSRGVSGVSSPVYFFSLFLTVWSQRRAQSCRREQGTKPLRELCLSGQRDQEKESLGGESRGGSGRWRGRRCPIA